MEERVSEKPMWRARLRWRLRGAWQWPTFAAMTLLDAVILSVLPLSGEGTDAVPAFLLAGFINLVVVAAIAPLGGMFLRRRPGDVPRDIATDRAGTAALLVTGVVLLAGGLIHRPAVTRIEDDRRIALQTARNYAAHRGPAEYRAGLARPSVWTQSPQLFRVCFPGPDPKRDLCLLVRTDEGQPVLRRDPDQTPNTLFAGRG